MFRSVCRCLLTAAAALTIAAAAAAQAVPQEPIGRFAADARGVFAQFPSSEIIASSMQLTPADLPSRGLGYVIGAHFYPMRLGPTTLGIGGEMLVAEGRRVIESIDNADAALPTVNARLSTLSPQLSFNFGGRDGWSYMSGGLGWSIFNPTRARPAEEEDIILLGGQPPRAIAKTLNYGGGARWFTSKHLAFSLDLRFYAISPQLATAGRPAFPRMRLLVLSGGVAFK